MFTPPEARPVNRIPSLSRFIARWDDASNVENERQVTLALSEFGNINQTGTPGASSSPICTPHQSQFAACLEAGIRPLTLLLVQRFGLVTHTSCEGHEYTTIALPPTPRHIGILPRSTAEARRVALLLAYVCSDRAAQQRGVKPMWLKQWLHDDERKLEAYDLYFVKRDDSSWRAYFSEVGAVSRAVEKRLSTL
jgi:hypothetical protein